MSVHGTLFRSDEARRRARHRPSPALILPLLLFVAAALLIAGLWARGDSAFGGNDKDMKATTEISGPAHL